jgi:hypothetical protein
VRACVTRPASRKGCASVRARMCVGVLHALTSMVHSVMLDSWLMAISYTSASFPAQQCTFTAPQTHVSGC